MSDREADHYGGLPIESKRTDAARSVAIQLAQRSTWSHVEEARIDAARIVADTRRLDALALISTLDRLHWRICGRELDDAQARRAAAISFEWAARLLTDQEAFDEVLEL